MAPHARNPAEVRTLDRPDAKPYVRIEKVTKKFGDFVAVDDVSLDIYKGEIFCLLGGSGCGKTTLLRMLAGFETPTAGRICIDGVDMTDLPPYERPVNMMFQSYALFPHMTVEQNIAFGLKQEGMRARPRSRSRVAEMLELVQAAASSPSASPTSSPAASASAWRWRARWSSSPSCCCSTSRWRALDKKLREHTQFELMNIQETLGITFIVVTHDQEEAMTLVDPHRA